MSQSLALNWPSSKSLGELLTIGESHKVFDATEIALPMYTKPKLKFDNVKSIAEEDHAKLSEATSRLGVFLDGLNAPVGYDIKFMVLIK